MFNGTIYCFCYDHQRPTGGQKDTYKHVDALNALSIKAVVLHAKEGFRLEWFDNSTPVISFAVFAERYIPYEDIVLLPEDMGERISSFPGWKVIFDKNIYYGFRSLGLVAPREYPALSPDVKGILTVSEHNLTHVRYSYPSVPVYRISPEINTSQFRSEQLEKKKLQFVYPRKAQMHVATLINMMSARSRVVPSKIANARWVMADLLTESEMSVLLRESLGLVFLSTEEGLGLLPLEAVASGCVVTCYGSGPLREIMPAEWQYEHGNLIGIGYHLMMLAELYPDRLVVAQSSVNDAQIRLQEFTPGRHLASVRAAWWDILARVSRRDEATST